MYRNATEPTQFKPVLFKGQLYLLYVLGALMLAAYIFTIVISSCWIDSFIIMKCPSLSPVTLFVLFFYFYFFKFILFIYFWLCWVFIAARGLSLVVANGGYSSLWYAGFSLQCPLLLRSMGSKSTGFSRCGLWAVECRLSSCGAQA